MRSRNAADRFTRQQLRGIIEGVCEGIGEARDGQEAIDAVSRLRRDGVLLDVSMPVRDGVSSVAGHRREHRRAIRVLFASQDDGRVDREEALRFGAAGSMRNDSVVTELLPAIRSALHDG